MKHKITWLIILALVVYACKDDRCLDASEIKHTYYFDEIRYHADKLELLIDDESWPLPKFREMLFTR